MLELIITLLLAFIIIAFYKLRAARKKVSLEEYVNERIHHGESKETIKSDLLKDLEGGGPLFGEFRKSIKATPNGVIDHLKGDSRFVEDYKATKYCWVALLNDDTCSDCIERHGQVKTMEEWKGIGLPQAGSTACKENCRCMLFDADTIVLKPIKRGTPCSSPLERVELLKKI